MFITVFELIGLVLSYLLFAVGVVCPLVALASVFTVDEYPATRVMKTFTPCMVLSLGFVGMGAPLIRWFVPVLPIMRWLPIIIGMEWLIVGGFAISYITWRMWPSHKEYDAALFRGEVKPMDFKLTFRWPFYEVIDEGYGMFKFYKGKRGIYRPHSDDERLSQP